MKKEEQVKSCDFLSLRRHKHAVTSHPQDATCLLQLVKEACDAHPTHKFTHVQPVWFQTPGQEFPDLVEHVKRVNDTSMTYTKGLKTVRDDNLSRLFTVYIANQEDFTNAMATLSSTTGIR